MNEKVSAPLDVLAVIASRVSRFDASGNAVRDETLDEARAAVAELVEAAKSFAAMCPSDEGLGGFAPRPAFHVAAVRIRAALAKFGGAA